MSTPPSATATSNLHSSSEYPPVLVQPLPQPSPLYSKQLSNGISRSPSRFLNVSPSPAGERSSFFAQQSRPSGSSPSPSPNLIHQHPPSHCGCPQNHSRWQRYCVLFSSCSFPCFCSCCSHCQKHPTQELSRSAEALPYQEAHLEFPHPDWISSVPSPSLPCHPVFHANPVLVCTLR